MTADPTYVGLLPWMAQWWLDHLDERPTVVIRCGHGDPQCRKAIGEVKADAERMMAMSKNEHPEVETDWTPLAAPTAEELVAELAERDAQALHYAGTGPGAGRISYKRTNAPREVAPVEHLGYYVCPDHGEVNVDVADLAAFARGVRAGSRSNFWARLVGPMS